MKMPQKYISVLLLCFPLTLSAQNFSVDSIEQTVASIEISGNLVQVFLPDIDVQYPIGIKRTAGNAEYTVAISEIRHSSLGHATATVFLRIHLTNKPEGQNKIYFAASGVPLTRNGGLQGDITLALVAPYTFSLGNDINITLLGAMNDGAIAEGSTSATVTCDGFKQLQLSAEVEFAGNLIKPADGSATMKSQFQTVVSDWNDIVADISLSPFEVQGLSNWVFSVENAIIDLSETQSSPNMLFPNSYQSEFPDAELKAFWKGVFIRDFSVLLPKSLSANEGLTNFIRGQNVLIDEHIGKAVLHGTVEMNIGESKSIQAQVRLPWKDDWASLKMMQCMDFC